MAKTSNRSRIIILLLAIGVLGIGAYAWQQRHASTPQPAGAVSPLESQVPTVSADRIDPAHEGWTVSVSGKLTIGTPARDTQLGVSADAVMLLRYVEMLQWREQCAGQKCEHKTVWSPQRIDSKRFREPDGHKNPERLPMTAARFSAGNVRLGAFLIDAAILGNYRLGAGLQAKPVAYPVTSAQLPSNLAISFRDFNGGLYAGNDPQNPAVGDVRVSYRIISAGDVQMEGVQRGERLVVKKSMPLPAQPGG
jgi:transmembrane protein TMEM43